MSGFRKAPVENWETIFLLKFLLYTINEFQTETHQAMTEKIFVLLINLVLALHGTGEASRLILIRYPRGKIS